MNSIAGISFHQYSLTQNFDGKMIGSFNLNHFALILKVHEDPTKHKDVYVIDQTGKHYIPIEQIDYFYY